MKEIKTFAELEEIENKKIDEAYSLNLFFILKGIRIVDGFILIIGADCKNSVELFYMSFENYNLLNDTQKIYIRMKYKV